MEFLIFNKQKLVLFKKKSQMKTIVIFGFSIITLKLFKKKKLYEVFSSILGEIWSLSKIG